MPIAGLRTWAQWLERYLDEVAVSSVRVSDFYRSWLRHLPPESLRRLHAITFLCNGVAMFLRNRYDKRW